MHFVDNFILQSNVEVDDSNSYGHHQNLSGAEITCENDSQCIGIYDPSCNRNGPFTLVKNGYMTSYSSQNCIYKKKRYNGE